jgi:hypothetical protein
MATAAKFRIDVERDSKQDDLQSLEQGLKSNDLSAAQRALAKFQQSTQGVQKSGSSAGSSVISPESSGEESRFDVMA